MITDGSADVAERGVDTGAGEGAAGGVADVAERGVDAGAGEGAAGRVADALVFADDERI